MLQTLYSMIVLLLKIVDTLEITPIRNTDDSEMFTLIFSWLLKRFKASFASTVELNLALTAVRLARL